MKPIKKIIGGVSDYKKGAKTFDVGEKGSSLGITGIFDNAFVAGICCPPSHRSGFLFFSQVLPQYW
ncbi:MAG: hypothetical protein GXZ02_00540 [Clostridiales bacterium]|nr:hypothetical protein [Clostridiales bacterium]